MIRHIARRSRAHSIRDTTDPTHWISCSSGGNVVIGYGGRHRGSLRPDSAGRIDLADDLLRSLDPGALSPARAAGLLCAISYALGAGEEL